MYAIAFRPLFLIKASFKLHALNVDHNISITMFSPSSSIWKDYITTPTYSIVE